MTSIAHTSAVERIARVLSADALSSDGLPAGDAAIAPAVSDRVDESWSQEVQRACAVLHTLREPTEAMVAAGDTAQGGSAEIWNAMVRAAIAEFGE